MLIRRLAILSVIFLSVFISSMAAININNCLSAETGEPDRYVQLKIIPEMTDVMAGDIMFIAIEQDIYPGWHTYWINPGDSGKEMELNWKLPDGFTTSALEWPMPKKIDVGPLTSYGFEGKATMLQLMTIPDDLPDGPIELTADVSLLVCKEICIPEYETITIKLNEGKNISNSEYIDKAHNFIPFDDGWSLLFSEKDGELLLPIDIGITRLINAVDLDTLSIMPLQWGIIHNPSKTGYLLEDGNFFLKHKRGDRPIHDLELILGLITFTRPDGNIRSITFSASPDPEWQKQAIIDASTNHTDPVASTISNNNEKPAALPANIGPISDISLGKAIIFALFGGIILNLMPCVFPVLSMKSLSLCKLRGKELRMARIHGISYTAGIITSFAIIAGALIIAKAGGSQIGWGFQLQSPIVTMLLSWLLFFIGLNFSGFFSITTNFANIGGKFLLKHDYSASFLTGVLATLVATPCTIPFMGTAVGFALTQPSLIAMTIFLSLGFGLALPYLLLSFFPSLQLILPKPGHWMETFKEFMAFPMYVSAAWLAWVYAQQSDAAGIFHILTGAVTISFAIWIMKSCPKNNRVFSSLLVVAFILASFYLATIIGDEKKATQNTTSASITFWKPYSQELFVSLEKGNDPIFINLTADWCITCKINEKTVLDKTDTKELFRKNNVSYLKGDWTNRNNEITRFLSHYDRGGVPLYIYYGPRNKESGKRPEPKILPQILTQSIITNTINDKS
jgi:thiol:disulfide interchange protein DsbD